MSKINFLTKDKYINLTEKYKGDHWTPGTINQRWEYHSQVISLVKSLDISNPSNVIEMGTMGISCIDGSDTIDYLERWDFPGKQPTFIHDARKTPWPIEDKRYELFIALRVFQHLTPFQKEATKEAMRIARKVIIVVPDFYNNEQLPASRGIAYMDFVNFLGGIHPNLCFPTQDEFVYYWDVEYPSRINLENTINRKLISNHRTLIPTERMETSFLYKKVREKKEALTGKVLHIVRKLRGFRSLTMSADFATTNTRHLLKTNRHIEFIGPAGVGKSTICEEAKKHAIGDWDYKKDLHGILPQSSKGRVDEKHYWRLLYSKTQHIDGSNYSSYQKIRLIKYFSEVLLNDMAMICRDSSSKKFLLDEGLCHNFSGELMDFSDSDLKLLMAERALVFVQARSVATIVNQIRKRERETGQMVVYQTGLDDDKLKEISESNSSLLISFIERAEALGVPVCRIIVEDGLYVNVNHFLDFEKRFVQAI